MATDGDTVPEPEPDLELQSNFAALRLYSGSVKVQYGGDGDVERARLSVSALGELEFREDEVDGKVLRIGRAVGCSVAAEPETAPHSLRVALVENDSKGTNKYSISADTFEGSEGLSALREALMLAESPNLETCEDMILLGDMNNAALLRNLGLRYWEDNIFVRALPCPAQHVLLRLPDASLTLQRAVLLCSDVRRPGSDRCQPVQNDPDLHRCPRGAVLFPQRSRRNSAPQSARAMHFERGD